MFKAVVFACTLHTHVNIMRSVSMLTTLLMLLLTNEINEYNELLFYNIKHKVSIHESYACSVCFCMHDGISKQGSLEEESPQGF